MAVLFEPVLENYFSNISNSIFKKDLCTITFMNVIIKHVLISCQKLYLMLYISVRCRFPYGETI